MHKPRNYIGWSSRTANKLCCIVSIPLQTMRRMKGNERERERKKKIASLSRMVRKISRKNRLQNLHARAVCFYDSRSFIGWSARNAFSRYTEKIKKERKKWYSKLFYLKKPCLGCKQAMNVGKEIRSLFNFNINPKNQVAQGSLENSAREISSLRAVKKSLPRRRNKIFLCPTAYNERSSRRKEESRGWPDDTRG